MRIEIDQLEGAGQKFAHAYTLDELPLEEEGARLIEAPQVQGSASRKGEEVRLRGTITARAEVECDRCLKAVPVSVETEFDVTYIPANAYESNERAELQAEDLLLSVFEGDAIDIDEVVREQLLLALSARTLCREECLGLCPTCGADRNANSCACRTEEGDPRWAALKNLVNGQ